MDSKCEYMRKRKSVHSILSINSNIFNPDQEIDLAKYEESYIRRISVPDTIELSEKLPEINHDLHTEYSSYEPNLHTFNAIYNGDAKNQKISKTNKYITIEKNHYKLEDQYIYDKEDIKNTITRNIKNWMINTHTSSTNGTNIYESKGLFRAKKPLRSFYDVALSQNSKKIDNEDNYCIKNANTLKHDSDDIHVSISNKTENNFGNQNKELPQCMLTSGIFFQVFNKKNINKDRRRNYIKKYTTFRQTINPAANLQKNPKIELELEESRVLNFPALNEKYDKTDETQKKAKDVVKILKKIARNNSIDPPNIKITKEKSATSLFTNSTPSNMHINLPGNFHKPNDKKEILRRSTLEIEDPKSILHIANYAQNTDFDKYTQINVQNNSKILRFNMTDIHTFFRIQHEIGEFYRKEGEFIKQRISHMNQLSVKMDLNVYEEKILSENNDAILNEKIKSSKEYQKGLELGKLIKPIKNKNRKIFNAIAASEACCKLDMLKGISEASPEPSNFQNAISKIRNEFFKQMIYLQTS